MDQDPFGLTTRDIRGAYELEQWEDGSTYYLQGPSHLTNPGWGVIEGTVGKLGWSEDTLLVWQQDCGSGSGWRRIDVKNDTISPVMSQDQIDANPSLSKITVTSAAEAWNRLK